MKRHELEVIALLDELNNKSAGVFLWVVLACRSLLSGFADCDRISELRVLVDELPKELQQMFERMLSTVKGRHRVQGAKLLRIVYRNEVARRGPEQLGECISPLSLARLDDSFVHLADVNTDNRMEDCLRFEGRLRSRTGGLIEVHYQPDFEHHVGDSGATSPHELKRLFHAQVAFMHRTVFEFLDTSETWKLACLNFKELDSGVDASISLCHTTSALLEREKWNIPALKRLTEGLVWGTKADNASPSCETHIFWELLRGKWNLHRHLPGLLWITADSAPAHIAMGLAVEFGAVKFMARNKPRLNDMCELEPNCGCYRPLLFIAIQRPLQAMVRTADGTVCQFTEGRKNIIQLLLSSGCDPNAVYTNTNGTTVTPWALWLQKAAEYCLKVETLARDGKSGNGTTDHLPFLKKTRSDAEILLCLQTAKVFLEFGADLCVVVEWGSATWGSIKFGVVETLKKMAWWPNTSERVRDMLDSLLHLTGKRRETDTATFAAMFSP